MNYQDNKNISDLLEQRMPAPSPLKRLVVGLTLLCLVVGIMASYQLIKTRQQALLDAEKKAEVLTEVLRQTVVSMLEKTDMTVRVVSEEIEHQMAEGGVEPKRVQRFVERQFKMAPELDSIRVVNADGMVTFGSGPVSSSPVSIADRDYFIYLRDNNVDALFITNPLIGKISKKTVIGCARRITLADGSFGGVVVGILTLKNFTDLFATLPTGLNGSVTLRRDDFTLLARYSTVKYDTGKFAPGTSLVSDEWKAAVKSGKRSAGTYKAKSMTDGVERIYSYAKISPYNLYVNVGISRSDALLELRKEVVVILLAFSTFILLACLLIWLQQRAWSSNSDANFERERLLKMLEATQNELYLFDTVSLKFNYVNKSAAKNLGYSIEQMKGMTPLDLNPYIDDKNFQNLLNQLLSGDKQLLTFESVHRRADGSEYPVDVYLQLVAARSSSSSSSSFLAVIHDATRRKSMEAELVRNLARLELMQEVNQYHASSVQDLLDFALEKVLALTDSNIGYIYHYCEVERQFVLNTWSKGVMPACSVAEPQSVYKLESTGIWGEVVRQRRSIMINEYAAPSDLKKGYPEGHVPLSRFLSIPVFESDRIVAVVGVANKILPYDQTDELQLTLMMEGVWKIVSRLKLEEQIRHAGIEWQNTFDSISDSISLIDAEQIILRCNQATSKMLGLQYSEIIGQPCWRLFHAADAPIQECPMCKAKLSLHSESATIRQGVRWFEVTVDPLLSAEGVLTGAVHIVRDVTERINLVKETEDISELFRLFMKHSPVYTYIKEVTGTESRVLQASDNFKDMVGINPEEMIGKTMHEIFPKEFADSITKDDLQVVASKKVLFMEEKLNDRSYITYKFPIERENGRSLLAGYTINITELKQAEESLRDIQTQLMQNDKLATIGQLAAGVAHEINNPIGFVSSNMITLGKYIEKYNRYIELLENRVRSSLDGVLPEQIVEAHKAMKLEYIFRDINVLLDESNEGIERVKRIVRDLRTFSRADTFEMASADLNNCMDSTINIVINEIKYAAELNLNYGHIPKVSCNAQQISQVFMNLLINAAHAIQAKGEDVGEIKVTTWSDDSNAFVSISDTGCGITPENLEKIFDAFYTTKEVGKGTGLGLSISAGIIRKHGGEIAVKSQTGEGSTFTIRLPLEHSDNHAGNKS